MTPAPPVVTCGDPAGIGPEIAARAWDSLRGALPFAWLGDPRHLPRGTPHAEIATPAEAADCASAALPVMARPFPAPAQPGRPDPANAPHVVAAIREGAELALSGAAGALVTAPVSKQALREGAGFGFPGHTEFLAHLSGAGRVVMMLASPLLRVVPATIHLPLAAVPGALTGELIAGTVMLTRNALHRDFAIAAPRIAVAGLNPHAGEGGHIGREEIEIITPALDRLRARGIDVAGPLSADTMFHPEARARYDAAVCMYHDQALIPIKTLDFAGGVNVTLGLPFVRTSPDHGTAFDIAGRGLADPSSLIAALRLAVELAANRARAPA
jgi:4-hydroxythreonine-4-phosphate dehydrogenase